VADPIYYANKVGKDFYEDTVNYSPDYALISFSVHGAANDPRFAAVWWPRNGSLPTQKFVLGDDLTGLSLAEAAMTVGEKTQFGSYLPAYVAVIGTAPSTARFFLVFEFLGPAIDRQFKFDVKGSALPDLMKSLRDKDKILKWACLYGTLDVPYAAFVSELQPATGTEEKPAKNSPVAWNQESFDDAAMLFARVGAYAQGGVRPALIAPLTRPGKPSPKPPYGTMKEHGTVEPKKRDINDYAHPDTPQDKWKPAATPPVSKFLSIWYDDVMGGWAPGYEIGNWWCAFDDLSQSGFYAVDAKVSGDLKPIRIMGSGQGAATRFAVIWAREHLPAARKWAVKALGAKPVVWPGQTQPPDPFKPFDSWMESFMKDRGIRAGQLAIVRGGKLVCAHAYHWAEPGFAVDNFSTFRIGSVSKIITAIATWQVIEKTWTNPDVPPEDKLTPQTDVATAAVLAKLVEPDNSDLSLPRFEDVNVTHLLRHRSGLREPTADADKVHDYYDLIYPIETATSFLGYHANKSESFNFKAATGKYKYSNFAYLLLQEAVRQYGDKPFYALPEYVAITRASIFEKLDITNRPHFGKIARGEQESGEMLHQVPVPIVGTSQAHNDGRLAYSAYGLNGTLSASPGVSGWVMAAVDVARILAALRPSGPLFDDAQTLAWLFAPVAPPGNVGFGSPANFDPTAGGWWWRWQPNTMSPKGFDLVFFKNGIVKGGSCCAMLWNPLDAEEDITGAFICFDKDFGDFIDDAISSFQGYLVDITGANKWPGPDVDLFDEVLDDS